MTGLERLRVLAWEMAKSKPCDELHRINGDDGSNCFGRSCSSCRREALEKVADQIEREHLREVDDISGRDADAIALVESHGGIAECDRKVEASMEVGDKYTLLRMELGKMLGYDPMGQLNASDEELVEKVGKRLMPEGMEWPRYEDGEPLSFGREYLNSKGNSATLRTVFIKDLRDVLGGDIFWKLGKGASAVELKNGERVKRPENPVLAADGEPLEVGQTVYHIADGCEYRVVELRKGGAMVEAHGKPTGRCRADYLTHQRPVLDTDGVPIHEGDTVYGIETGEPVTVNCVEGGNPWFVTTDGTIWHCSKFTHRAPVLAADGEPLKVGQTVWNINNGMEFNVSRLPKPGEYQAVEVRYRNGSSTSFDSCQLTHQRPVLDAGGNRIEPAMDVWWICEGDERGIHAERLHVDGIDGDGMVECHPYNGGTSVVLDPAELYVKKPALDADGVLCREGDEVWEVRSHRRREIVGTHYRDYETGEPLILCDGDDAIPIPATCVTHAKPEPPDSWERIEEDKGLNPFDYCKKVGHKLDTCENAERFKANDIVRRCKALAERDAS